MLEQPRKRAVVLDETRANDFRNAFNNAPDPVSPADLTATLFDALGLVRMQR